MRARYSRWTGEHDPLAVAATAQDVLDEMADDLLSGMRPDQALSSLLRRGLPRRGVEGLDSLRSRVAEARRLQQRRLGVDGPLRLAAERLEAILDAERRALELDPGEAASGKRAFLDDLPPGTAARIAALESYDWADRRAGEAFRALVDDLRRDVADAAFGRIAGSLASLSTHDVDRLRDLLADLNALVAARDRGAQDAAEFERFKQRYADLLPGDPGTLEDLLESLARRMTAMSRLIAGMDAEQRGELAGLAGQLLGDLGVAFEASQLERTLRRDYPDLGWDEAMPGARGSGQADGGLSATVDWMQHLQELDELAEALDQRYPGARLEDVDVDVLRRALGADAAQDLRRLRQIERMLEEAGAARRRDGRLQLTPLGVRRIGERSLARIYGRAIAGPAGAHAAARAGGAGELTGATRPLTFGDPFRLDVGRTLREAIVRRGAARGARDAAWGGSVSGSRPIEVSASDFQLAEAERRVRVATVLLLDLSFSMPLRGNWVPAKRVALALHALVSSRFPQDSFDIVGFSDYARRMQPHELVSAAWERVYGTNMQHAFMLARRLISRQTDASERQVIMITDGEPTAHLAGGEARFAWPPEGATLQRTMFEARRLERAGATLNVFLLDHDPGAAEFVETMVSACRGRIFYPDLNDLGRVVVRDFLRGR